jgi:preprotein translocase subunit SecY
VIFAATLMAFPPTAAQYVQTHWAKSLSSFFNPNGWAFVLGESLLIVAFTFLYTAVTFNPVDQADALRKHGVAIETVRQLEAQLAMRSYATFLKDPTTPPRGRSNLARAAGPESDRGDAHKRRAQTASS